MELGFTKANSSNLPRVDSLMLGEFLASNKDLYSAEFRNVSSRPSYGDDAISYVQLKRDGNLCVVKSNICPEHKIHGKLYGVTLVVLLKFILALVHPWKYNVCPLLYQSVV
ncbi:hypothetical protein ACJJTC_009424 [Scirpophaga incertulas]